MSEYDLLRPEYFTTKEVAEYLRIKERRVYELVSKKQLPASRIGGKWIFPRDLVDAWVRQHVAYPDDMRPAERPLVIAGSHDPLLEWAIRESRSGIATYFDSSLDGIRRVAEGRAMAAGTHIFEPRHFGNGDYNLDAVAQTAAGLPVVLVEWCYRKQTIMIRPHDRKGINCLWDLHKKTVMTRQEDSGSYLLLQHLLSQEEVPPDVTFHHKRARSEADVALAVKNGVVDAGFGSAAVARLHGLECVEHYLERFDILIYRREFFEFPFQTLLDFTRTKAFAQRAGELGTYSLSGLGTVHYNGP